MGRKNAAHKKNNADKASTTSSSARSSARSSVSTAPTTPGGATTPTTHFSVSNTDVKLPASPQRYDCPPSHRREVSTKPWWIRCTRWMPQPCNWWPCRLFRKSTQAITIFLRGFTSSKNCWDRCMVVILLVAVFFGCWVAIEGLLSIVKLVSAQDANCSIVYVTIPGPIITVSLIGASASDPARGTYYYSVIDGTTQWLNSNAPPSRPPVRSTSMVSTGVLYTSSWSIANPLNPPVSVPPTPGLPVASFTLPPTAPIKSTDASKGLPYTSSWSIRSTLNSLASVPTMPGLSNTLSGASPMPPGLSSTSVTTITSTVTQGLTPTSTSPITATPPGGFTFSESWFTLSLPKPSLPSSIASSAISDSSTSPKESSNAPQTTTVSYTSVTISTFLSNTPSPSSLSASSPTGASSILLTGSSIQSSIVVSTTLSSTSGTPSPSSSSLTSYSTGFPLATFSLTSTRTPPAPVSSRWLNTTLMASTTFVEPSVISSDLLSSTFRPLPSWGNFTSSVLNSSTLTRGSSFSPSFTPSTSSSQMPLFSMTTSRDWNGISAAQITQILSFGNTAYSFILSVPDITTTVSYWTGSYPTASGTETGIPTLLTTRTIRQTPLSALPSFELFKPQPTGFKTIVLGSATRTIVAAAAETTGCGEYGNFTLNFDDTSVGPAKSNILPVNGLTNPYHHLFYANGYTYMPDKWEPYPAISQPNIAMFLPLGGLLPNTPFAGTLLPGEIGAGPRASVSAYWFNAFYGYFGCALNGITPCTLRISGYRYDATLKQEVLAAEQNVTIPACYGYIKCRLTQVFFNDQFKALSGIQFNAYSYHLGIPQVFMMDSLQMEWYNSSCAAGILRIGHR